MLALPGIKHILSGDCRCIGAVFRLDGKFQQGLLRRQTHGFGQHSQLIRQGFDAPGIEQVAGIGDQHFDAIGAVCEVHTQVEMHFPRHQPVQPHGQIGEALRAAGRLLGALDLEQRVSARLAGWRQRLQELVERQLGMFLGLEQGAAHLMQQRSKTAALIDPVAQHAEGGEVAHHPLGFSPRAVGQRRTDAHAVGAAVAGEQQVEQRQHGHEGGGAAGLGQVAQALAGIAGQLHAHTGTA